MASRRILIVGGGTAGWMTALLFQRAFDHFPITLVESSAVGTIGVGEGSTPALKAFMDAVGLAERDWMPACRATFKSGIAFRNWSTREGFGEYFHPFFSHFDRDHIKALAFNAQRRRAFRNVHAHPNAFAYSHYLAERKLCPITPYSFPFEVQYGFHFNAGLLGRFLKDRAIERGVICRDVHVTDVVLDAQGDISHLVAGDGEELHADFFVDCSGLKSLITGEALGTPRVSYAQALFNDRAVTLPTPVEDEVSTRTLATALDNGWTWKIPLQDRVGNGYVYSSRYCSPDEAEAELRAHLGVGPADGEATHLEFRVGRAQSVWNRNSLAVGLSQGFLEPLEATALALVQLTIARFVRHYTAGGFSNRFADRLNREIADAFDSVKDYLHTHFLTSDREDTKYWRDCRRNSGAVSARLKRIFEVWFANGNLAQALEDTGLDRHYKINSWIYILSGMGIFPPAGDLEPADPRDLERVPMAAIADFLERCSLNHIPQREALESMRAGREPLADERKTPAAEDEALATLPGLDFGLSS